jgi:FkbM family methyltransferase
MNFISYAQNYEDVMLFRALRHIEEGFYIDVGAQDPVADSVTKAFYERGWHGINIEPAQHWHERLAADRPRDINLRLAASDHRGTLRFYDVAGTGLSTTQESIAAQNSEAGRQVAQCEVECRTLDEICAEYAVEQVNFLKVDVEGAESAVLRGMPFDRIRPWIIVVEAILPISRTPAWQEWQPLLDAHGYACVYEDGLNRFYLSSEHPELKEAFRFPPNVFDDFVDRRSELAVKALASENERREAALVQMRAESAAQKLDLRAKEAELVRQSRLLEERDNLIAKQEQSLQEREAFIAKQGRTVQEREAYIAKQDRSLQEREAFIAKQARTVQEREAYIAKQDRSLQERNALIAQQGRELKLLQTELGRLCSEIDYMHGQAIAAGAAFDHQREEIRARDQVIAELSGTVRALHASTSWRITAPLRAATTWIRTLVRISARGVFQLLRPPARMARPLLRKLARIAWLRASAGILSGARARAAAHVRLFMFGPGRSDDVAQAPSQDRLSRSSRRVLGEIHALLGKAPRKP